MTNNQRLAVVGVAAAAAAAIVFGVGIAAAKQSPAPSPQPTPSPPPTTTGPGPILRPPSPSWRPATTLRKGARYRASGTVVDALRTLGFTTYVPGDAIPSDWPASDVDPRRYRVEGEWTGATMPLPAWLPPDTIVWEFIHSNNQWTPTTTLRKGWTYRASVDLAADLAADGFRILNQHEAPPGDWPADDLGPGRWRVEGVWELPDSPVGPEFFSLASGRLYELALGA